MAIRKRMAHDSFQFKQFTIRQDRCAMKVGTDGTLLGAWAHGGQRILDVGTGTGLIALMMAQRFPEAEVTAIDIDAEAVRQAQENVMTSPFRDRIKTYLMDIRTYPSPGLAYDPSPTGEGNLNGSGEEEDIQPVGLSKPFSCTEGNGDGIDGSGYSSIVCNPPFFISSLKCPDSRRSIARHADTLTYGQLMTAARRLLDEDGELSVVIPAEGRERMDQEAALAGMFKSRQWAVRTAAGKPPKRYLMAFTLHPRPLETGEITLGTPQAQELTKDFYL